MENIFNKAKDTLVNAANTAASNTLPQSTGPSASNPTNTTTRTTNRNLQPTTTSTTSHHGHPDITTTSHTYSSTGPRNPTQPAEYQGNSGISHRGPLRAGDPFDAVSPSAGGEGRGRQTGGMDSVRDFRSPEREGVTRRYDETGGFGGKGGRNLMMRDGDGVLNRGMGESVRDVVAGGGGDMGAGPGLGLEGAQGVKGNRKGYGAYERDLAGAATGVDTAAKPTVTTQRYSNSGGAVGDAKVEIGGGRSRGAGGRSHDTTGPSSSTSASAGGNTHSSLENPYASALEFAANYLLGTNTTSPTSTSTSTSTGQQTAAAAQSSPTWSTLFKSALETLHKPSPSSTSSSSTTAPAVPPLDEKMYIDSHRAAYSQLPPRHGTTPSMTPQSLGAAAAMQALKILTSSHSSSTSSHPTSTTPDLNSFIGTAMAECARLYDPAHPSSALTTNVSRQSAVTQAAKMALALWRSAQADEAAVGGGGGLGSAGAGGVLPGGGAGGFGGGAGNVLLDLAGRYLTGAGMGMGM